MKNETWTQHALGEVKTLLDGIIATRHPDDYPHALGVCQGKAMCALAYIEVLLKRAKEEVSAEAHPEQYCPAKNCLYRTGGGHCPRHTQAAVCTDSGCKGCVDCVPELSDAK